MALNFDPLARCTDTLERALTHLDATAPEAADYDVYRYAVIKGFELTIAIAGKMLRKALREYAGNPKAVNELVFKDVLRHAAKHGLMTEQEVGRWFTYRDSRNDTTHDYGEEFAKRVVVMIRAFVADARHLHATLESRHGNGTEA